MLPDSTGRRHAVVVTFGSSGDVHPFLGLGTELIRRGWKVTLVTNARYGDLATQHGLEFLPIGTPEEYDRFVADPGIWHPNKAAKLIFGEVARTVPPTHELLASLSPKPDVVIASSLAVGGRVFHETHDVPLVTVHLAATVFRSNFDPPRLPGVPSLHWLPEVVKPHILRHFWAGADRYVLDPLFTDVNTFRAKFGLEAVTSVIGHWWHSPQRVLAMWPEWFAPPPIDWPEQTRFCGFPLYDERQTAHMSPELEIFLEEGKPPIAFTPGTAMLFGEQFFAAAVGACERLGRRGLLLTRYSSHIPQKLPAGVRHEPYAPFSQLLPRCAAIVHHGGIGTLSQGLAAGLPQVVMPMAHDQLDNARRLRELGVGAGIGPRRFTARRLTAALRSLLESPDVARRCAECTAKIAPNAGVETACDEVEAVAGTGVAGTRA